MILTDLSNAIKKLWEKISFHKHFKSGRMYELGTSKIGRNHEIVVFTRWSY